jgi:hypothetical protein
VSTSDHDAVLKVIGQLNKYAEQLASCELDPHVDVAALNRACKDRLAALQRLMALRGSDEKGQGSGARTSERSKLVQALQTLETKTLDCITVLESGLERTDKELGMSRLRNKGVQAYAGKR